MHRLFELPHIDFRLADRNGAWLVVDVDGTTAVLTDIEARKLRDAIDRWLDHPRSSAEENDAPEG